MGTAAYAGPGPNGPFRAAEGTCTVFQPAARPNDGGASAQRARVLRPAQLFSVDVGKRLRELGRIEAGVGASGGQQFGVGATFDDPSGLHDQD